MFKNELKYPIKYKNTKKRIFDYLASLSLCFLVFVGFWFLVVNNVLFILTTFF